MRLVLALSLLASTSCAQLFGGLSAKYHVTNAPDRVWNVAFPSVHQSAVMARRIAHLASYGDLVTVFPSDPTRAESDDEFEVLGSRPYGLGGSPIGLVEYIADCEADSGNPTLLAIDIATPFRNYRAGSNVSLSIRWWPRQESTYNRLSSLFSNLDATEIPTPHTVAALPRFSLHGHLEAINKTTLHDQKIAACFIKKHPDSIYWQPTGGAHESHYVRFVVEEIFWFGGFGDRARIEWLPLEEWRGVTRKEIEEYRLPGERQRHGRLQWFKGSL